MQAYVIFRRVFLIFICFILFIYVQKKKNRKEIKINQKINITVCAQYRYITLPWFVPLKLDKNIKKYIYFFYISF